MNVKINKSVGRYDNREVPYTEMLVSGDKHTLSIRKYPKTVSMIMWQNSDRNGTKVSMKFPHSKFEFFEHTADMMGNFEVDMDFDALMRVIVTLENKWEEATKEDSF